MKEGAHTFKGDDGDYYGRTVATNERELTRTSEGYEHAEDARTAMVDAALLTLVDLTTPAEALRRLADLVDKEAAAQEEAH